jgi:hypothetical protein
MFTLHSRQRKGELASVLWLAVVDFYVRICFSLKTAAFSQETTPIPPARTGRARTSNIFAVAVGTASAEANAAFDEAIESQRHRVPLFSREPTHGRGEDLVRTYHLGAS